MASPIALVTPLSHAVGGGRLDDIVLRFDPDFQAATVTAETIRIFGDQSGLLGGRLTVVGDQVRFTPSKALKPGETITIVVTDGVRRSDGTPFGPYTTDFIAATRASRADLIAAPNPWNERNTVATLGDLDGDGDLDAIVASLSDHEVLLNDGRGNFALNVNLSLPASRSQAIRLGDLDSDGDLDAFGITYNDVRSNDVSSFVWLNDGEANFALASGASIGLLDSSDVQLGDLDGDGDLDAFVVGNGANVILRNDGAGSFSPNFSPTDFTGSDDRVALGDLDGDGDLDALVTSRPSFYFSSGNNVSLLLNDGRGNFHLSTQHPPTMNDHSGEVALGDLDGDGDLDAFVAAADYQKANEILLNDGEGNFVLVGDPAGNEQLALGRAEDIDLGDLDGDGDLDAVLSIYKGRDTVLLNNGQGKFSLGFQGADDFSQGTAVDLGDLDGNGTLDIWFAHYNGGDHIWLNRQPNNLPVGDVRIVGTPTEGQGLVLGHSLSDADGLGTITYEWQQKDSNHDWNPIVGATGDRFTPTSAQVGQQLRGVIRYRDGEGTDETVYSSATREIPRLSAALPPIQTRPDFNGDNASDILIRHGSQTVLQLFDGITETSRLSLSPTIRDPNWDIQAVGLFNGDNIFDLVWRNSATGQNVLWMMDGQQQGLEAIALNSVTHKDWVMCGSGDMNGDRNSDLLWFNTDTKAVVVWYLNNGAEIGRASISEPLTNPMSEANWQLTGSGDFDGNQTFDLLWRNGDTGEIRLWFMDRYLQRTADIAIATAADTSATDLSWVIAGQGDYDQNGISDIVWLHTGTGATKLWLMQSIGVNRVVPLSLTVPIEMS